MTRRKQNAPKHVKNTDKPGRNSTNQQSVNSSLVISDSGAEEEDEETTSDEENVDDILVDIHTSLPSVLDGQSTSRLYIDSISEHGSDHENHNSISEQELSNTAKSIYLETNQESRNPKASSTLEQVTSGLPHQTERTQSSSSPGSCFTNQNRYSRKLSSTSPRSILDSQMALVMSSLPLGILSGRRSSLSPLKPAVSVPASGQQDDQPLDLSRKSERSASLSSPDDKITVSRNCSSSESTFTLSAPSSNGCSSLQSLQQRFGGDYPLELSQKSGLAIIPLQANMTSKLVVPSADAVMHSGLGKPKLNQCSDPIEKHELPGAAVSSPIQKGENCRHASPTSDDEPGAEISNRYTIHRCSCQKSFSTLYALSLHLQETSHTPGSNKMPSLMDYRKLVRGQDMWLNQESEQTRRILRCMQCGESFTSLPLLTVHMMQTQHYTKIVSSDHGRRSHKCSTYCDRELDRECIFKCKVCHEVFSDMEGLASHMIMSGHHKKQSSRQHSDPTAFLGEMSSISRQGQRKRHHPEDIMAGGSSGNSPFTVASLLEFKRKQAVNNTCVANGLHSEVKRGSDCKSLETPSLRAVMCESCGRNVESHDFDSHVRACLRQRAEVIDALKSKLALEEALLSRSESKLLRSGFSLSSVCGHPKDVFPNSESTGREAFCHEYKENYSEKHFVKHSSLVKSEKPSHDKSCCRHSPELRSIVKNSGSGAQMCDLKEVPVKKWYCSNDGSRQAVQEEIHRNSYSENSAKVSTKMHHSSTNYSNSKLHKSIKKENLDPEVPEEVKSISGNEAEVNGEPSEADTANDALNRMREQSQRLNPNIVQEDMGESLDLTYSALHKLDMFSRGLKLSPPRRNISPESKIPPHHSAKVPRKKESSSSNIRSPVPVSSSPLTHLRTESPGPSKTDVIFDIIDPNSGPDVTESTTSALEAMESFINKSFNAKSEICSSNLASMFSPFRNCFPLPGSLAGQTGFLPETSDRALSHFAKFSRFFRMVPGVTLLSEITSDEPADNNGAGGCNIKPEANNEKLQDVSQPHRGTSNDKFSTQSKNTDIKSCTSPSTMKIPAVKLPLELLAATSSIKDHKTLDDKKVDIFPLSKKYKYSTASFTDAINSHAMSHNQCLISSSFSGNKYVLQHDLMRFTEDNHLPSHASLTAELQRKRKAELKFDFDDISSKKRDMNSHDVPKDKIVVDVMKNVSAVDVTKNVSAVDVTKNVSVVDVTKNVSAVDVTKNVSVVDVTKNVSVVDVTKNVSDVDVTKNVSTVDVTKNVSAVDVTKKVSAVDVTKNVSAVDITKNVSVVDVTKNVSDVDVTKNVSAVDVTKNVSAVDVTKNVSTVDVTKNVSAVDVTKNISTVDVTKNVSAVDVTKNVSDVGVTRNVSAVDVTKNVSAVDVTKNVSIVDDAKKIHAVGVTKDISVDVDKDVSAVDVCAVDVTMDVSVVDVNKDVSAVDVNKDLTTVDVTKDVKAVDVTMDDKNIDVTHDKWDEQNKDNKCCSIKEESKYKSDEEKQVSEDNSSIHSQKSSTSTLTHSLETLLHEICWKPQMEVQQLDTSKKEVNSTNILGINIAGEDSFKDEFIHKCDTFTKPESKHDICRVILAEDDVSDPQADNATSTVGGDLLLNQCCHDDSISEVCSSFNLEANVHVSDNHHLVSRKRTLCGKLVVAAGEDNCYHCDGDVDTDDDVVDCTDKTRSSSFIRKNKERKKYKTEAVDVKAGDVGDVETISICKLNVKEEEVSRYEAKVPEDAVNSDGVDCDGDSEHWEGDVSKVTIRKDKSSGVMNLLSNQLDEDVAKGVDALNQNVNMQYDLDNQNKQRSEHFSETTTENSEVSKFSNCKNKAICDKTLLPEQTSCCEQGRKIITSQDVSSKLESHNNIQYLPECRTIVISDKMEKQKQKKKSALDSLSSFVFNQPLTTEHPLDSLQKLLSTNDLTHLPADPEKHFAATSYKCLTPELCTSQNLSSKGGVTSGNCSTDDNEDDEPCLTGGGASEGDLREYKCAACNRRFASKGSYRYHLSRCHLSSVKKYGIKEAFNMSPYVYLPLDHTAKFSKYYQMAQELANKEK